MSEVKENKEQNQSEVMDTIVNKPIANIVQLVTKFCADNDNNRINEWSCTTLINIIKNNCSEVITTVKKATDKYEVDIKKLTEKIKSLEVDRSQKKVDNKEIEDSKKKNDISEESMAEVLKLNKNQDKKDKL